MLAQNRLGDRGVQGLFADMLFVLSEPIPPLVKAKVAIPAGHRKCAGCGEIRPISCFWQKRARCKDCLGAAGRTAYLRRIKEQKSVPVRRSKFDDQKPR